MVFLLKKNKGLPIAKSVGLLGNFEESMLNGRIAPTRVVEDFSAEIVATNFSLNQCSKRIHLPVTVFFYAIHDHDKVTTPYLGYINLNKTRYRVPGRDGVIQLALFNPCGTAVHIFLVRYDLKDMPANSRTFLRQRTYCMPSGTSPNDLSARKWLRYLIHLRFETSKSGRLYLHTDLRLIIFRNGDMESTSNNNTGTKTYEIRSITESPNNPQYSPKS
ncbi:atos homolog atossa [Brevipalpus obovatus]|uniref:atos homolog atossa n=1 Tax=Brevipalpus obovatus TaxID=246614 RepID=UPI003D9E5E44